MIGRRKSVDKRTRLLPFNYLIIQTARLGVKRRTLDIMSPVVATIASSAAHLINFWLGNYSYRYQSKERFFSLLIFAFVTRRPYCPGRLKELCFTTQSLVVKTVGAWLSVVKQSSFGLPGQYGRRVTKANCFACCFVFFQGDVCFCYWRKVASHLRNMGKYCWILEVVQRWCCCSSRSRIQER